MAPLHVYMALFNGQFSLKWPKLCPRRRYFDSVFILIKLNDSPKGKDEKRRRLVLWFECRWHHYMFTQPCSMDSPHYDSHNFVPKEDIIILFSHL